MRDSKQRETPNGNRDQQFRFTQFNPTEQDDPLEAAISRRLNDLDEGKYRRNNASVLRRFANYIRATEDITTVSGITVEALRQVARALRRDVSDGAMTASTADQYWKLISSFLTWAQNEGVLDENPASLTTSREPLPDSDETSDTQFWTPRDRKAICATADQHLDRTLSEYDSSGRRAIAASRDVAIVYALGYTGCRAAELAAVPEDPKRHGLSWEDIDFERGIATVYGKNRTEEDTVVLGPAMEKLSNFKQRLDPEPDWAVFPTTHLPTLYDQLPDTVEPDYERIWEQLQEYNVTPPSVTTNGVRQILKRLCEDSDWFDDDRVLRPHGARRGLGDQLYREQAELAQEALRHKSIDTTHDAYHEERLAESREEMNNVIGDVDDDIDIGS